MSVEGERRIGRRLYPRAVRQRLGEDLAALLEFRRRSMGRGPVGAARYAMWLLGDLGRIWFVAASEALRDGIGRTAVSFRVGRGASAGDVVRDVRVAWRGLVRRPVFTVTVLATLGLTIGAGTTIYSAVDWVLLRPLPYPESDRLVNVGMKMSDTDPYRLAGISVPNLRDWRTGLTAITQLSGATWTEHILAEGSPVALRGAAVTDGFFETLGAAPMAGRSFGPADHEPGAGDVAILSWDTWQTRFGGDPAVIGSSVRMRSGPLLVVGVMPAGFRGPEMLGLGHIGIWTPMILDDPAWSNRGMRPLVVIGRLAEHASLESARADLERVTSVLAASYPEANRTREGEPWLGGTVLLQSRAMAAVGRPLVLLLASVGLLLLIGCVNVANLVLARGTERAREMSIRLAIGSGRGGVARQVLLESLILAAIGGVIGCGLAWLGLIVFRGLAPANLPRLGEIALDLRVLLVAFTASAATGIAFGLVPALRLSRVDPARGLGAEARGSTAGRKVAHARAGLTVLETSLALVLLVAAGLLFNSLLHLQSVDKGFEAEGVVRARVSPGNVAGDERVRFYRQVVERLEGRAGITGVTLALNAPLETTDWRASISIEDPAASWTGGTDTGTLLPGYFDVLRIPLLEGRDFADSDDANAMPVAIVNKSFAERAWPGMEAVGQRLRLSAAIDGEEPWRRVVGVVGDVRQSALDAAPEPMVWVPFAQEAWSRSLNLLVRSGPDRSATASAIRDAMAELDPSAPPPAVSSMDDRVHALTRPARLLAVLLAAFGGLGTVLAAVGLYGTMAYAVRVRRREFGIRMALGASSRDIGAAELRRGAIILAAGLSVGLAGATATARMISGFLFEVHPLDTGTIALVTAILATVGLAAAVGPARAAARTSPNDSLRAD